MVTLVSSILVWTRTIRVQCFIDVEYYSVKEFSNTRQTRQKSIEHTYLCSKNFQF